MKLIRITKAALLSLLLASSAALSISAPLLSTTVFADEIPDDGLTVTVNNTQATLTSEGVLTISPINGSDTFNPYAYFGDSSMPLANYKEGIRKIILTDGIISISGSAQNGSNFYPNVEEVRLPESCTSIRDAAFADCTKLKKIKFSSNTENVGGNSFLGCASLEKVNLYPTMVLKNHAFAASGLKTIDLPEGITIKTSGSWNSNYQFHSLPSVENVIVRGNLNMQISGSNEISTFCEGVVMKKVVYLADTWYDLLMNNVVAKSNINTTVYCTEENYELVHSKFSSKGAKLIKISSMDDISSSSISDDNVTLNDILYDVEEVTDGDELNIPIEGETNVAIIRLSVPTEVGFVISPTTKSKFITKPFKIVNQTGAPVDFKLTKLHRTTETNSIKSVPHNYKNREAEDWIKLGQEETEEGIALKVMFDVTGGDNFTSTTDMLWEDPVESLGDNTYVDLAFDTDGFITGKLGGLYGLAWTQEYTGSYKLTGEVHLRN